MPTNKAYKGEPSGEARKRLQLSGPKRKAANKKAATMYKKKIRRKKT